MNLNSIFTSRNINILGFVISIISIGLVLKVIFEFFTLPSTRDQYLYPGVDFIKYKEQTISQIFFWFLFLIFGIGIIRKNNWGWIIPQFILLSGLLGIIWIYFESEKARIDRTLIIIDLIYISITILVVRFSLLKKTKTYFRIKNNRMILYYSLILLLSIIYWILYLRLWE